MISRVLVTVVPTFAPKMNPSDSEKVSSPAPTNPTAATVVALDDWSAAVDSAPVRAPFHGLSTARASIRLSRSSASDSALRS